MIKKRIGVVKNFNGYHGIIMSNDIEYLFFVHDIVEDQKIQVNDKVKFFERIIYDQRGKTYIAYFITKEKSL